MTPNIQTSQAYVQVATGGEASNARVGQAYVQVVAVQPTAGIQTSQAYVQAITTSTTEAILASHAYVTVLTDGATEDICTSQAYTQVVVGGAIDDPVVRAWTYTIDGHDFYVLRLGDKETLVYDVHSDQWSIYGSGRINSLAWKAQTGSNWAGGTDRPPDGSSNVFVGDNITGALYFLDPDFDLDDGRTSGSFSFERRFTGQVVYKGDYSKKRVGYVDVLGSVGQTDTLEEVTLEYSDNRGKTYTDAGTVSVPSGATQDRIRWRSLGSMRQPGRLFRVTDDGALKRVDSMKAVLPDLKE